MRAHSCMDINVYLSQNKCPKSRKSAKSIVRMAQDYMLLDGLLFKITHDKLRDEPSSVLCIPTLKVDMLLDSYHSSLLGGHAGITKCYMTICQRFYCPNLSNHIRAYIMRGCFRCSSCVCVSLLQVRSYDRANFASLFDRECRPVTVSRTLCKSDVR